MAGYLRALALGLFALLVLAIWMSLLAANRTIAQAQLQLTAAVGAAHDQGAALQRCEAGAAQERAQRAKR